MSETAAPTPEWVTLADGRRAPFEVDTICEALFRATESLGRPDAFLARQLADAVVYFLAQDDDAGAPSTARIAELIVKVVRELGQPELARAYERRQRRTNASQSVAEPESPAELVRTCLESYSLRTVFGPDLAAAHRAGLIMLGGLHTPAQLAAAVVEARALPELTMGVRTALDSAGQSLILDSPEWLGIADGDAALFCQGLLELPVLLERSVVFNVNCGEAPAWAQARGRGPLFPAETPGQRADFLTLLLDRWSGAARLEYHLGSTDLNGAAAPPALQRAAALATRPPPIAFVFDRPRLPIALAAGIDRQRPALLQEVSLVLTEFLNRPDVAADPGRFFEKLPSLARMAVSAAAQKRKFLRGRMEGRGFLLDRARLVVTPRGIAETVRRLTGQSPAHSAPALDCASRIVAALADSVSAAARRLHLDAAVNVATEIEPREAPPAEKQLQTAGKLQVLTGHGTARIVCPGSLDVDGVIELLHYAWKRTGLVRLEFCTATQHAGGR